MVATSYIPLPSQDLLWDLVGYLRWPATPTPFPGWAPRQRASPNRATVGCSSQESRSPRRDRSALSRC